MATIEGTHQHAMTGRRYRFKAVYRTTDTELHWTAEWFSEDGALRRARDGVIHDVVFITFPYRAVIEQVVDAIDAS